MIFFQKLITSLLIDLESSFLFRSKEKNVRFLAIAKRLRSDDLWKNRSKKSVSKVGGRVTFAQIIILNFKLTPSYYMSCDGQLNKDHTDAYSIKIHSGIQDQSAFNCSQNGENARDEMK